MPVWQTVLGIVVVLGVIGAVGWFFIFKPKTHYVAVVNTYEIVREYPNPAAISFEESQSKWFSPEMERRYIDGEGLNVKVIAEEGGRQDAAPDHILLEPFKKYDEKPVPERRPEIDSAKTKLKQLIDELNHPPVKVLVFVDNTDDDPQLPGWVFGQYVDYVRGMSTNGNHVNLKVHRITGAHFSDPSEKEYVPSDQIENRIKTMSQPLGTDPAKNTSAIASDMFRDLTDDNRRDPLNKDARVLLFSDLLENDPKTVSFELLPLSDIHNLEAALGNPEKREALKQRLQAVETCPGLNGARVDVYLPPYEDKLPRMKALFPLWKEIWLEHGATSVDLHY